MPMNPDDYAPNWNEISQRIRTIRAGNVCERCGVENHAIIHRHGSNGEYNLATDDELSQLKKLREVERWGIWRCLNYLRLTKIILTVAHLDRDRTNNADSNLAALCQRCHLGHDMTQHVRNRKYGRHHDREHQLTVELNHKSNGPNT